MNNLHLLLDEYLATRRAPGARLEGRGQLLKRFVAFLARRQAIFITTRLAMQWATEPRHAQPAQWANRLGMVRGFAHYANAVDPRHEVPSKRLLPYRCHRRAPYIYSDTGIADLIAAARGLSGTNGLRPLTHATLLGLLAVTGMRVSEAVNLKREDVDLTQAVLTVRNSKFDKSRHVPMHETTRQALSRYVAQRDRLCPNPLGPEFFLAEQGARISAAAVRWTFAKLSMQIGLRHPSKFHGNGPRLHDLRHSFAVNTLLQWYRDGVDVERHLPRLTTWLGHGHVNNTYWYLTATPQLLQFAARRLDRLARRPQS